MSGHDLQEDATRQSAGGEAKPGPATADDAPQASGDRLDLEKLIGLWPAVMDQVRSQGSELLSHALAAARPIAVDVEQAVLQVGFPAGARFNKRKAEVPDARQRFAEAVKTIVGEQLRPVYVLLEGEDAADEAQAGDELSADELIEKLKAEFDAEEFEADPVPDAASDAGAPGMDAGLDAGPGMDTGQTGEAAA